MFDAWFREISQRPGREVQTHPRESDGPLSYQAAPEVYEGLPPEHREVGGTCAATAHDLGIAVAGHPGAVRLMIIHHGLYCATRWFPPGVD
jgi:hypothetical protein